MTRSAKRVHVSCDLFSLIQPTNARTLCVAYIYAAYTGYFTAKASKALLISICIATLHCFILCKLLVPIDHPEPWFWASLFHAPKHIFSDGNGG
jgi:hypothetical protein